MLGDFITRILILALGYAYPGFECFKAVEKNKVEIEELRFWCQYWIIVALITVLEKFTDIMISWLPFYGEMKVGLFIYLWYPRTKGTKYIYKSFLRPFVSRHETEIDRKLMEWKSRVWDLGIFYWQYFAQYGHTAFFQGLQYVASQSTRFGGHTSQRDSRHHQQEQEQEQEEVDAETPAKRASFFTNKQVNLSSKSKKWPPSPPSSPSYPLYRNLSLTPRARTIQTQPNFRPDNGTEPEAINIDASDESVKDHLYQARARLRRMNPDSPRTPRSPHI